MATAALLRATALDSRLSFQIVESVTTEVGPRLAGSPGDVRAVAWAEAKLKSLGFDTVWTEPVPIPAWERGEGTAEILTPFPQPLTITALGNSVATPPMGIEAEVVAFPTLEALAAAPADSLKGRIAYVGQRMWRTQDGSAYGAVVPMRSGAAAEAAKRGAVATLIRSVGTDTHRFPHTGMMRYEAGLPQIPVAALSNPDADLLERQLRHGKPVTVRLRLSPTTGPERQSRTVIAEIRGRERPEEIVLLGAHLDSWDLGTGAIDDGAGIGIVTAAATLIRDLPQRPRRTIRVVLFAAEEIGLVGGRAYAMAHRAELPNHVLATEADFGGGRVWRLETRLPEARRPEAKPFATALLPLGIALDGNEAHGGPDLGPMRAVGVPVLTLAQDGSDYFDVHHTADDTLDKIDPAALAQATAAYAIIAWLAAEGEGDLRSGAE
ncbi:M28 family peptidase [Oleisolibacter albus]|uniref:M28 family peptidase n=1 Tax=Oleisolibacter albus TaxID=2171757 RepID=UPI00195F267C|nr:M28 family peptidase [Oleisolibacter albus]